MNTKQLLLINLGGPRNENEIEKFLSDLLGDPLVFDLPLPEWFRYPLSQFIVKRRTPKVKSVYRAIGLNGGSPLVSETENQAKEIEKILKQKSKENWRVGVSMNCAYPALKEMQIESITPSKENWILPLFPHFSRSTTLSAAKIIQDKIGKDPQALEGWLGAFYHEPKYVAAIASLILDYFQGKLIKENFIQLDNSTEIVNWRSLPLIFSAHGIPLRLIKKGDTYRDEIETNFREITQELRMRGYEGETFLSFQSRVGPAKWTEPFTQDTIIELSKKGHKRMAVYPISFVSDHLETIVEIGQEFKHIAIENGVQEFYRIPAPGTYPKFIEFLVDLVLSRVEQWA